MTKLSFRDTATKYGQQECKIINTGKQPILKVYKSGLVADNYYFCSNITLKIFTQWSVIYKITNWKDWRPKQKTSLCHDGYPKNVCTLCTVFISVFLFQTRIQWKLNRSRKRWKGFPKAWQDICSGNSRQMIWATSLQNYVQCRADG